MEFVEILKDIPLAPYTTLKLGGCASYFVICRSELEILEALRFAKERNIPHWILGGGSNTIVSDQGYLGLVIKIEIKGIECLSETESEMVVQVGAGEIWDSFVTYSLEQGLSGLECLSGIPGCVGASPIQNIGAYGQDVSETIDQVRFVNQFESLVEVTNSECNFSYRNSRFKSGDWNKNVVTRVTFRLSKKTPVQIKYPEVEKQWKMVATKESSRTEELFALRKLILGLRKTKSMVLDESDPNTKSVGSFFTNPILSSELTDAFLSRVSQLGLTPPQIYIENEETFKIPAAWLIESAGFHKGMNRNGVGISSAHSLALINIKGRTQDLLNLADEIKSSVLKQFNIKLSMEPVILC